jgi:hypothetical protein
MSHYYYCQSWHAVAAETISGKFMRPLTWVAKGSPNENDWLTCKPGQHIP